MRSLEGCKRSVQNEECTYKESRKNAPLQAEGFPENPFISQRTVPEQIDPGGNGGSSGEDHQCKKSDEYKKCAPAWPRGFLFLWPIDRLVQTCASSRGSPPAAEIRCSSGPALCGRLPQITPCLANATHSTLVLLRALCILWLRPGGAAQERPSQNGGQAVRNHSAQMFPGCISKKKGHFFPANPEARNVGN